MNLEMGGARKIVHEGLKTARLASFRKTGDAGTPTSANTCPTAPFSSRQQQPPLALHQRQRPFSGTANADVVFFFITSDRQNAQPLPRRATARCTRARGRQKRRRGPPPATTKGPKAEETEEEREAEEEE